VEIKIFKIIFKKSLIAVRRLGKIGLIINKFLPLVVIWRLVAFRLVKLPPPPPPLRFESFPGHGLPLRGFLVTLTGHTTLGRTPLDD